MADWSGAYHTMEVQFPQSGPIRVYDLAQPMEPGMSRHPAHPPYAFSLTKLHKDHPYPNGISSTSELVATGTHVGTHVDALGHISNCGEIHGGHEIDDLHTIKEGLQVGSVEEIPPLLGRGHLIDGEELFGRLPEPGDAIGPEQLETWFAKHEAPREGSIVLVRTGWLRFWDDTSRYIGLQTGLPGVNRAGAEWLSKRGILAAGSDTMNFEHKVPDVVCLSVHVHFLVESGIYIMETLNLETLAADGITDFIFFAVPLRIRGASGSPIRPVAIVAESDVARD